VCALSRHVPFLTGQKGDGKSRRAGRAAADGPAPAGAANRNSLRSDIDLRNAPLWGRAVRDATPREARRTLWPGPDLTIHLRVLRRSFSTQVATDTRGCHSELDSESPWPHLALSRRFRIGVRNDKQLKFLIGTTEAGCQVRKSFPAVSGRGMPLPYVNPFTVPTRTAPTPTTQRSNVKRVTLNPEPLTPNRVSVERETHYPQPFNAKTFNPETPNPQHETHTPQPQHPTP
jgi:hypothetical protein